MPPLLRAAVCAAALWAAAALATMLLRTRAFTLKPRFARPAGRVGDGVRYALLEGMAPGAKESVRNHLGTWMAGIGYHGGLAAALVLLVLLALGLQSPLPLRAVLGTLTGLGALCGLGLLAKRILSTNLRAISCPDDYASNLLSTGLAALGCAWALGAAVEALLLGWGAALLLYAPVGKIRHCAFFAATRIQFGAFFGRRGALPHAPKGDPTA